MPCPYSEHVHYGVQAIQIIFTFKDFEWMCIYLLCHNTIEGTLISNKLLLHQLS